MRVPLGIITVFIVLSVVSIIPVSAAAHPMLDRAIAEYEAAKLSDALRTFNAAARNADLSVEELLKLLEMRALVHHALGDDKAMRADLHRLAAVRGSYQLSTLAPPAVREAFDEVRESHAGEQGVELVIEQQTIEGAAWMVAQVVRVPDGLVDHTTLQCSVDGDVRTLSRTSQGTSVSLELPKSGTHSGCAATARTRQGGVLFSANLDPLHAASLPSNRRGFRLPQYQAPSDQADTKKSKKKWPWIVGAVGIAVVGGVTAGVLLSKRSSGETSEPEVGGVTVAW